MLLGNANLTKKWRVHRVANLSHGIGGAELADTNDTKTMGSDIGTIQKACSVIGANFMERRVRCAIPICSPLPPR
jgi:hypothetical protein